MPTRIKDVTVSMAIDAPLFKAQRTVLLNILDRTCLTDKERMHLSGILNVTDEIYDALYPIEEEA